MAPGWEATPSGLDELAAGVRVVERTIRDWPLRFGAYRIDGLTVWGATARILSQLGQVVADRVNWHESRAR